MAKNCDPQRGCDVKFSIFGGRVSKQEAGFVVPDKPLDKEGVRCNNCTFYSHLLNGCHPVKGSLSPSGTCNLFSEKGKLRLDYPSGEEVKAILESGTQLTKKQAGYLCQITNAIKPKIDTNGVHCGSCYYFNPNGSCTLVKGPISANNCCNIWTSSKELELDYSSGPDVAKKLGLEPTKDIEDLVC